MLVWTYHSGTKEQHTENIQINGESTSHWSLITCFFLDLNDVLYITILLSICGDYNVEADAEQYYKTQILLTHTYFHMYTYNILQRYNHKVTKYVTEWGK